MSETRVGFIVDAGTVEVAAVQVPDGSYRVFCGTVCMGTVLRGAQDLRIRSIVQLGPDSWGPGWVTMKPWHADNADRSFAELGEAVEACVRAFVTRREESR